ncbi:putative calcium ion transporter Vcx1 [Glonium stellatum]|uniref:Vacuolar calcium ion transporter n=1 Tax=Glonium stellatum TaxID=574774 RepID=A0A8E2F3C2_9PEZI|nr:putative calcium ion transporter Vcx1 [Glonium stellatum]
MLCKSYINVLLVFVPIGIIAGGLGFAAATVFFLNFLAIIPLALFTAIWAGELSASVGHVLGGILNATLGNAVEIIVGAIAVGQGEIHIAQWSLLGSILSGSLPVLGISFFLAGYGKESLNFDKTLTGILSSLVMIASASLIVPTVVSSAFQRLDPLEAHTDSRTLILSRGTAIILFILFIIYLYFKLETHTNLFLYSIANTSATNEERRACNSAEEEEGPTLGPWASSCALIITTLCVFRCASYLIHSASGSAVALSMSKSFIGIVLIPIVSNAAKWATAVTSRNHRMDLVIRATLGSVLQITLFVAPLLILLGWLLQQPMTLNFRVFEAGVFFLTVIVVNCLIHDGRTNYFEGAMMMGTYIIIAVAFYVRSDPAGV